MAVNEFSIPVGNVRDRHQVINLGAYWRDQRFEYSSNLVIYKGVHHTHNSATDAADWEIWKFTYSGNNVTRIEGPLSGAWDDRAALDWVA